MTRWGRLALLVLLARWTVLFLFWPMRQNVIGASFLHLVSLPFHEAGHVLFSPFGTLMTALGGSLMQVLVPLVCLVAFMTTSPNPFGAAVMTWWAGENLLDVAMYANDARALQLVLIGGRTGAEVEGHDWERILGMLGLLHRDHQIALVLQALGAIVMLGGIACAAWIALRKDDR
ncbi:MAG: hypothetical protein ACM3SQ_18275 [Betaproteobacteria bacterium]